MDQASSRTLHEAKGGSEEAINQLFERCAGRLLVLIHLRLGPSLRNRVESRDVLQNTFLKAFERLDQLEASDSRSLMAWLAGIASNEIRDLADYHHRQRRDAGREVPLAEVASGVLAEQVRSQSSRVALSQELERLERALESLDEAHREVIVLRKLEELGFAEIGQRMGRSPDACRMLLARALTKLTLAMGGRP